MHHALHHTTPDTHPSVRSKRAANPHATFPEKFRSDHADVRFPPVILPIGCDNRGVLKDFEHCYRAVRGRDVRFDGWFYVAVTSTGIYCRPSCPAATPKRSNVRFFPTAAAAQYAGFRACKRCRPDAVPGSPEWDTRADIVARAMRRRQGRCCRARAAAQLHRAPPAPPALCGRWSRSTRARPCAARPHSQAAHRDHRSAHHRGSVRRRIHEHTPVQRHDPRGLRCNPERAAARSRSA
jgi:hypothetical protein